MTLYRGTAADELFWSNYVSPTVRTKAQVSPGPADDTLYGGGGNDIIDVTGGSDLIYGGAGNDQIKFYTGTTQAYGGTGNDHIWVFDAAGSAVFGGHGNDTIEGDVGVRIYGAGDDDVLYVVGGTAYGGTGNDTFYSFGGDDGRMVGGTGNDTLHAGGGNDTLVGGSGADFFAFSRVDHEGFNIVNDFQLGVDKIAVAQSSFEEVTLSRGKGGQNTVITLDSGTEIVLRGIAYGTLQESDFQFV